MLSKSLLSIKLNNLTTFALHDLLLNWLNSASQHIIVTPNPEIILLAQKDKDFAGILNRADLSLPDGIGLKFAAWLNSFNLCRHTGVDTVELLAKLCAETNQKLLLFGGQEKNTKAAAEKLRQKFFTLDIVTFSLGTISESGETNEKTIQEIVRIAPNVLVVALGQGKQEKFIDRYLNNFPSVKIAIGIGGALDMIGTTLPRAPKILRSLGFEWLWRLIIEPSRWRRIVRAVVIFPLVIVFDRFFTKKQK
jgi:N-acetylglucosaminyldiphosphoundecaprenol N-acetyl-beta-D-mannosaminyltransferase